MGYNCTIAQFYSLVGRRNEYAPGMLGTECHGLMYIIDQLGPFEEYVGQDKTTKGTFLLVPLSLIYNEMFNNIIQLGLR